MWLVLELSIYSNSLYTYIFIIILLVRLYETQSRFTDSTIINSETAFL